MFGDEAVYSADLSAAPAAFFRAGPDETKRSATGQRRHVAIPRQQTNIKQTEGTNKDLTLPGCVARNKPGRHEQPKADFSR